MKSFNLYFFGFFVGVFLLGVSILPTCAADFGRGQKKLTLTITSQNQKVAIGEPLVIDIVIKNVSSSPVNLTYFKPHFWTPQIIDRKSGEKLPFSAEIMTETNIPVEKVHRRLAAGESFAEQSFALYIFDQPSKENLTYVVCRPGEYKARLDVRFVKNNRKDWAGVLESNRIPIEIVERSPSAAQEESKFAATQAAWKKIAFAEIEKRVRMANLPDLRLRGLPPNDFEIRFWIGFGLWGIEGLIIRRETGKWSAAWLESLRENRPRNNLQKNLPAPKSGWENFWKRIKDESVLTLPDSSELKNEN